MANTVQSIGSFSATLTPGNGPGQPFTALNGGAGITIRGLKLDSNFFDAVPEMENSKRIALVGGGPGAVDTAALTTCVQMGEITLNVIRVNGVVSGDLIRFCLAWQLLPDSTGCTLNVSYNINGATEFWTFQGCTLGKVPPLKLAGNDLPEYSITLKYGSFNVS